MNLKFWNCNHPLVFDFIVESKMAFAEDVKRVYTKKLIFVHFGQRLNSQTLQTNISRGFFHFEAYFDFSWLLIIFEEHKKWIIDAFNSQATSAYFIFWWPRGEEKSNEVS